MSENKNKCYHQLGIIYFNQGFKDTINFEFAKRTFKKMILIDKFNPIPYYELSILYENGLGCEKDFSKMLKYLLISSKLKHLLSIQKLAVYYHSIEIYDSSLPLFEYLFYLNQLNDDCLLLYSKYYSNFNFNNDNDLKKEYILKSIDILNNNPEKFSNDIKELKNCL
jgi:hypothetical protein